ncbi:pyrin domain-containing protein 3-like [Dipodomys spectabilis]|uniref:pyrin domain-containing protein 3-like n=1 Tax=Dipodomys spectabilis TaxID=105255 RepID=UPI001C53B6FB|nr:pyrin domain-containing protein 3-like [Dipodomys spectabilis]
MADNTGFLPDGYRCGPVRTVLYPTRNRPPVEEEEIPVRAIAHLALGQRCGQRQLAAPLPTWGQVKKLTGEGQKMLKRTGKPVTAENLFLAIY